MTHQTPPEHFQGKSVTEHLRDARRKGATASGEIHGEDLPSHLNESLSACSYMALALLLLWLMGLSEKALALFALGFLIWMAGSTALRAWAKMERLHRLIEEERWEIEHHRAQEREELSELYAAKGFSGKLLEEVVDVLMADDNRLLKVMLEEELGLSLEREPHPLKLAFSTALGGVVAALLLFLGAKLWPAAGVPLVALLLIAGSALFTARWDKRRSLNALIWHLALALFATASVYFLL